MGISVISKQIGLYISRETMQEKSLPAWLLGYVFQNVLRTHAEGGSYDSYLLRQIEFNVCAF